MDVANWQSVLNCWFNLLRWKLGQPYDPSRHQRITISWSGAITHGTFRKYLPNAYAVRYGVCTNTRNRSVRPVIEDYFQHFKPSFGLAEVRRLLAEYHQQDSVWSKNVIWVGTWVFVRHVKKATPEPLKTYGCYPHIAAQAKATMGSRAQHYFDQWAFANRRSIDDGAPLRVDLFKKIASVLNPNYFEWHSWTDKMIDAACNHPWIGVAGCSGSAKTHNITGFACTWWLCNPKESSVIYCSTTAKALRKRGWSNVSRYYTTIPTEVSGPAGLGNFVDSRMLWQATKGDDAHAIMGIAVEEGDTTKVSDNIKGVHTRRQLVIIDEATSVPPAIFEACTNLYSYPEEFILIMIGNPRKRLDEFGKFCEPDSGWHTVTIEDEEWETKPQINGVKGICIRFDAEKSPNIIEGKIVSKHLPTKEKVEQRRNKVGSENDPSYWSNDRGFWAPEGISKTLFTEVSLIATDAYGSHKFTGNGFRIIGAFDPARTGDRPTLRFAAYGEIEGPVDLMGLEWMKPIVIDIDASSTVTIAFQLRDKVRRACENVIYRGQQHICNPRNLGIDSTGAGAEICDIFQQTWSAEIMRIDFGGGASESQCSHEDIRPANKVYRNLRAEMYHRTRNLFNSLQIKGVDVETAKELCNLEYNDDRALIVMASKEDYKIKYHSSPDFADSGVIETEVARRLGMKVAPQGETVKRFDDFQKQVEAAQNVYATVEYAPEEKPEPEEEGQPAMEIITFGTGLDLDN